MQPIVGIVGGLGPEGTVHYYRKLTARLAALPQEAARPGIAVDHVWIDRFSALLRAGADPEALELLLGSLRRLERAGATLALFAAVTPHRFLPALRPRSPLPIADLVGATCEDVRAAGHRVVGLVGTRFTVSEPFFRDALEAAGVRVVVPDEAGTDYLDALIFGPLARGEKTPGMKAELTAIVARMARREPLGALVVACTDLMELMGSEVPLLDPIDSHLRLALRMLGASGARAQ